MSGAVLVRPPARLRRILTPEGVHVPFEIATVGDRIAAFGIDALLIHAVVLVLLLGGLLAGLATGGVALSLAIVASFLLRNFYFVYLELRWGGRTVGKRVLGLRVISREAGPLTAEAVLARNLTRDLEFFLPLAALLQPAEFLPAGPGWGLLLAASWLFVFALLPLFNRDRLRCGDLVGGTLVVRAPRPVLLPDLARETEERMAERFVFSAAQLEHYGVRELQVLEDVLRGVDQGGRAELLDRVSEQIRARIGWAGEVDDPEAFLRSFYRAQREHLERRMLFGERRESKRS